MNEKLKYLTLFVIGMMLSLGMNAQSVKSISGTVTDDQGEAVISGTVKVKNGSTGTITDINGKYTLSVPSNATLVFSYIGYITQEFKVSELKSNVLNVVLQSDTKALDEVVVVGYGTMRKSDLTGSISTAKGKDMLKAQSFNALDGLKGKVAGVNIFSNTGQPGGESRVIIRGISTINASASPLYVVDGVVMSNFELLNPNDIESIEVLKDASSAAIYGARGANGVIMVTTKRGNAGKGVHVSYDGSLSIGKMARKIDVMDANEWMSTFKQGLENANEFQGKNFTTDLSQIFTDERLFNADGSPKYNTNWQDEASRTAISHNHQISIQRTGEGSSIGAFINYTDQQGILLNSYFKRINAKLAYDDKPTDWLSTSVNLLVNHTWGNRTSDNPYGQGALRTMIEQLPFLPVKLDGEYTQTNIINTSSILNNQTDPNSGKQGFSPEGVGNPVELLERMQAMQYRTQIFGNAALTFHLMKGLDLKTQFGIDYHNNRDANYTPFTPRPMINQSSEGAASANNSNSLYWQEETYLTYVKDINKHHINAMAGMSWQEYNYTKFEASDSKYIDDFYGYYNLGSGTNRPSVGSDYDKWAMNSYFLRFAYTYKDRYSATVTGRVDGSSKFGENNKYAFFPSAGLAWNVIQEDFMQDQNTISNLKLHTSYGLTGNSEIDTYKSLASVSSGTLLINDVRAPYSYISSMANPDLKWEKTGQFDVGFEIGFWQNRLSFDLAYYNKKTTDLLLDCPIPHTTGFTTVYKNIGSVRNQGMDLMISARPVQTQDFNWSSTINLNFNKNKILQLGDNNEDIEMNSWVGGSESILRVGENMSSFYGYRRLGVYTEEDFNNGLCEKNQIGRAKRSSEREIIGKGVPDWTGSMINTLRYKNWDFTLDLQFVAGVQTLQQFYHSTYDRFGQTNGLTNILYDAYNGTNPNSMQQAIWLFNGGHAGQDTLTDSQWVANGSYLRANLIQLGYTFDSNQLAKTPFSSLRLYLNVNNAFLITAKDFNGYDPESTSQISTSNGSVSPEQFGQNMAFFSYPRARTFTLGVNVTF